jgi:hypothetical protein
VLLTLLGTLVGLGVMATLAWTLLDALAARISMMAPAVAGSWVTAVALMAGAFTLAPQQETASESALRAPLAAPAPEQGEP